jgi:UTP:GlnB (protein PII) uridylyltransferase
MNNFSVGTVESKEAGQMKFFVQTGWRPYESQFHSNEGLIMLGDPQVFEATPEILERVLYRYQQTDVAASPELTFEIVRAYIKAREHNGHKMETIA